MEIYNRADIVNFMNTGTSSQPVWTRMQGFTDMATSSNTITYSRRYVDEKQEREDTTGYSKAIAYNFDRIVDNSIHERLAEIMDNEVVGADVEILSVNVKNNEAKKRTYSVIPDTAGDGTDAYQYSGTFRAKGEATNGTATISADGLTATFTEASV